MRYPQFVRGSPYISGRIAGLLIGWIIGGPLPMVIGFVIGHILDAHVRPIYSRAMPLRQGRDDFPAAVGRLVSHAMWSGRKYMPGSLEAEKVEFVASGLSWSRARANIFGRSLMHCASMQKDMSRDEVKREVQRVGSDLACRRLALEIVLLFEPDSIHFIGVYLEVDNEHLNLTANARARSAADWRYAYNFSVSFEERLRRRAAMDAEDMDDSVRRAGVRERIYDVSCQILSLPKDRLLSKREVVRAYKKLMSRVHPDKHPDEESAHWNKKASDASMARDVLLQRI